MIQESVLKHKMVKMQYMSGIFVYKISLPHPTHNPSPPPHIVCISSAQLSGYGQTLSVRGIQDKSVCPSGRISGQCPSFRLPGSPANLVSFWCPEIQVNVHLSGDWNFSQDLSLQYLKSLDNVRVSVPRISGQSLSVQPPEYLASAWTLSKELPDFNFNYWYMAVSGLTDYPWGQKQ